MSHTNGTNKALFGLDEGPRKIPSTGRLEPTNPELTVIHSDRKSSISRRQPAEDKAWQNDYPYKEDSLSATDFRDEGSDGERQVTEYTLNHSQSMLDKSTSGKDLCNTDWSQNQDNIKHWTDDNILDDEKKGHNMATPTNSHLEHPSNDVESDREERKINEYKDVQQIERKTSQNHRTKKKMKKKKKKDESVLVERDGTFEMIPISELRAEERQLYMPPSSSEEDELLEENEKIKRNYRAKSAYPASRRSKKIEERSKTIQYQQSAERRTLSEVRTPQKEKAQSYRSPYALSEQEKKILAHKLKQREKEQKEKHEKEKMEREEKEEKADETFKFWLQQKAKEKKQERKRQEQENKNDKQEEEDNRISPRSWLKEKSRQRRKEKKMEMLKKEEEKNDSGRSGNDNEKAFNKWLKDKQRQARQEAEESYFKRRLRKLIERKERIAREQRLRAELFYSSL